MVSNVGRPRVIRSHSPAVVGTAWFEPREVGAMMPVSEEGGGAGSVFGEPDLDQADILVSSLRDGSGRVDFTR